jgi:TctA family transporter
MELFSNLALGFSTSLQPANLAYCFIGTVLGTLVGILPGLGPTATIALLLPLTYALDPTAACIMIAGIYYGAQYGGSTTAILINLPGEAASAVCAIDGYQMARQGRAGSALAVAAIGSFFAGTVATLIVAAAAPLLAQIGLKFGSPEFFALLVLGLISSVALAHGSPAKALAMLVLGLVLGLIGKDTYTGQPRLTFGLFAMSDGLNIVAISVGLFGIAEILRNLSNESGDTVEPIKVNRLILTRDDVRASAAPVMRGTLIGSVLGILPGAGALLASFMSYAVEKKLAADPGRFGHGAIEGVAGPESANNAGAQTSFIPMLTLGIPANPIMALLMAVLIVHGITPGPRVATSHPDLFWGLIASMWIGNAMLLVFNLPLVRIWMLLLKVPYSMLLSSIVVFSSIGVYSIAYSGFDLVTMAVFGLAGYILTVLGFELVPLVLGFVIGPLLEEHFRRSMSISDGNPEIFVTQPISAALILVAVILIGFTLLPTVARQRKTVFVKGEID